MYFIVPLYVAVQIDQNHVFIYIHGFPIHKIVIIIQLEYHYGFIWCNVASPQL